MDALSSHQKKSYKKGIESLVELLAGFVLIVGINHIFFPEDPGFMKVNPHPFLFLTILMGARYGTFEGFLTGFISAVIYIIYLFADSDLNRIIQAFEWSQIIPAYLFIVLGLLVGEIRQMANNEVFKLVNELRDITVQHANLQKEHELIVKVKEELQKKIIISDDVIGEFCESTQRLEDMPADEIFLNVLDIVEKFTGAEKCSFYVKELDNFVLRANRGWEIGDSFKSVLELDDPIVEKVIASKQMATLKDFSHEGVRKEIIMCAPLMVDDENEIGGFLVINKIPFNRLTHTTMNNFLAISRWAAVSLKNARNYYAAMEHRIDDQTTETYNFGYLRKRLEEEIERTRRYKTSFTMLLVQVNELETLEEVEKRNFLRSFGSNLKNFLRKVDIVASYRMKGVYGIVLPSTSPQQALAVTSRIHEGFREKYQLFKGRYAHLYLKMGIAAPSPSLETVEHYLREAEKFELSKWQMG
ncbi:MAG: diguanylate cyclase [Deltaproteobacteria bacterium]|nr:diguanylate cyclase [Deltaproteobacteria bacterium]